jgi:hypothetical protein
MAEALAVIGAAGAIANIIDVASKTIKSLHDLHNRWRDADFTLLNLIAQLTALRAALSKIQEWIDQTEEATGRHHQLAMDMDASMTCVRMLIGKMDVEVEGLRRCVDENANGDGFGKLDLGSKIKVVFGGKGTGEEWQRLIERQVSALTLLLAACHWYVCHEVTRGKSMVDKREGLANRVPVIRSRTKKICLRSRAVGRSSNGSRMIRRRCMFIAIRRLSTVDVRTHFRRYR